MKRLYGGLDIRRYVHHMIDLDENEQVLYHNKHRGRFFISL
jgi:hypothetical protein